MNWFDYVFGELKWKKITAWMHDLGLELGVFVISATGTAVVVEKEN